MKLILQDNINIKNETKKVLDKKWSDLFKIESELKLNTSRIKKMRTYIKIFKGNKDKFYSVYQKTIRNEIMELKGNIRVFWRVRPIIESMDDPEDLVCRNGTDQLIKVHNSHKIEILSVNNQEKQDKTGKYKSQNTIEKAQWFEFDRVFGWKSTQSSIFEEVNDLVISALDGYKVCIFAFGQTGSGKTYTMEGNYDDGEHQGIIPRSIETLFKIISQRKEEGWEFEIDCNFQEIYCNEIRDLLKLENSMKQLNKASTYTATTITVSKQEDVLFLLKKAQENRSVGETTSNARSSRSHSIFQLIINSKHDKIDGGVTLEGAINLIDLAGSERIHKTGKNNNDIRLHESREINKSLSELKHVINSLAKKQSHIAYRNSKLTYILQDHLDSDSSKVLMVVNASPLAAHRQETINSLRFASEVNSWVLLKKK